MGWPAASSCTPSNTVPSMHGHVCGCVDRQCSRAAAAVVVSHASSHLVTLPGVLQGLDLVVCASSDEAAIKKVRAAAALHLAAAVAADRAVCQAPQSAYRVTPVRVSGPHRSLAPHLCVPWAGVVSAGAAQGDHAAL